MDFDPFDTTTWRKVDTLEDPEQRRRLLEKLEAIIVDSETWNGLNELCRVMEGCKPNPTFQKRLEEPEFKELVDWLLASDGRRERAAEALRTHLRLKRCPHCSVLIDETELTDPPPFDWEKFASEE